MVDVSSQNGEYLILAMRGVWWGEMGRRDVLNVARWISEWKPDKRLLTQTEDPPIALERGSIYLLRCIFILIQSSTLNKLTRQVSRDQINPTYCYHDLVQLERE